MMGKSKKRFRGGCDPSQCGMEDKIENTMVRFSSIAEKLADNQIEMRLTIQKLTDNFKLIEKMEEKINNVEDKVDKNSQMVWKMVGVGMALAVAVPVILGKFI